MKDLLGVEVVVGNMVAWPVRRGSWMEMHYGRVVEITEGVPRDEFSKKATVRSPYMWVDFPSVKVEIRTESREYTWGEDVTGKPMIFDSKVVVKKKVVKLHRLDRMLKIPAAHFSDEDREFFGV